MKSPDINYHTPPHLRELLHDVVDLCGPEPDAAGVEGAVRAAEHVDAARLGVDQHEVAVRPDPGVLGEVRGAVLGAILVSPEPVLSTTCDVSSF